MALFPSKALRILCLLSSAASYSMSSGLTQPLLDSPPSGHGNTHTGQCEVRFKPSVDPGELSEQRISIWEPPYLAKYKQQTLADKLAVLFCCCIRLKREDQNS